MSECKVCGRKNPVEGANFCYYCGASLRETDRDEREISENRRAADAEQDRQSGYSKIKAWITADDGEPDDDYDEYVKSEIRRSEREAAGNGGAPSISRWKILGLMMLLLLPIYGWLFLLGWAIVNVVSSRAADGQKEVAHGILMFFAAAVVLLFLLSAYLEAHPEVLEEYNRMYQQMMNTGV